ncbi:uncharacterized protein [Eurosta solidaginis]|uniref:uncharacterized protein n=1 Tax=Eurosta solidaginis TaxID=178769 RepID=UPI003530B8F8
MPRFPHTQTVISWIRPINRNFKQFVACRISEILSITTVNQWRWIPSSLNVADEATRARTKFEYILLSRWLQGPSFLYKDKELWPQKEPQLTSEHCISEEITKRVMLSSKGEYLINFSKFSSYSKVIRIFAWILRFVHNTKSGIRHRGELNAIEVGNAETTILHRVQAESFAAEIEALKMGKCVPKSSCLHQLTPFLDDDDLIKVNGRIDAAYCLPITARRPIILPYNHYITCLIVQQYHRKLHHQNDNLTINEMRQKFWVPRIRTLLKSVKRECAVCIANPVVPLMGQLPQDRLTPYVRPFSYTGVDYCGPFFVAIGRRREKRWVALFTCLTTRAVHLEIATDLSTDAFIICFRNFVNRRGVPIKIRSDNGTNFVGAQKELNKENRLFDFDLIDQEMCSRNIQWVFNCPANPSAINEEKVCLRKQWRISQNLKDRLWKR